MIYPIVAYGSPILRKVCTNIEPDELDIQKLIEDMFETMYSASGVGLAAPQIGLDKRIFVVDGTILNSDLEEGEESDKDLANFKKVFINAKIVSEEGAKWSYEEGCLSIPGIRADVSRYATLTIQYQDADLNTHMEVFKGMAARIIQHEYDHIEGVLFTDLIAPLRKQMIKKTLTQIQKGIVKVEYRMKFV